MVVDQDLKEGSEPSRLDVEIASRPEQAREFSFRQGEEKARSEAAGSFEIGDGALNIGPVGVLRENGSNADFEGRVARPPVLMAKVGADQAIGMAKGFHAVWRLSNRNIHLWCGTAGSGSWVLGETPGLTEMLLDNATDLLPITDRGAKPVFGVMKFALQLEKFLSGSFDLAIDGAGMFELKLFPMREGLLEPELRRVKPGTDGVGDGMRPGIQGGGEAPLLFSDFSQEDSFLRYTPEVLGEAEAMENPDGPLGGIELPRFHSVTVVMLEGMVKVVVALAKRKESHETAVAGRAAIGVGLAPDRVAERINEKGHLLHKYRPGDSGEQEPAQCRGPTTPKQTQDCRQQETGAQGDGQIVAMLPTHERIALQVVHVVQGRLGPQFEEQPADMRVEKAFGDVIGIIVLIYELVVATMVSGPRKHRMFKGSRPENKGEEAHGPGGLEGSMSEKSMISQRDTQTCRCKEKEEQQHLE
jgi:hypothetical protein